MIKKSKKRTFLYIIVENWAKQMLYASENKMLSQHTLKSYEVAYDNFVEYVREIEISQKKLRLTPDNIDVIFLSEFLNWVSKKIERTSKRKMKNSTRKQYMVRIGALLRYISKKKDNPYDFREMLEDMYIKTPEIIEKYVTEADRIKLFERYMSYYEGIKDNKDTQKLLMLKLLLFTGIRASELRGLRFDDFHDEGDCYSFKVFGKGGKERFCYISHDLSSFVNRLNGTLPGIKEELEFLQQTKTYICEIGGGRPMCARSLWNYTKAIFQESGIKMTGVHCFRHGTGRMLTSRNVPLTTVQEIFGQSDVKVTARYTKANEKMKKAALLGL
ncbi:MAG: tyrosine-type recombinase/integrase [Campylobacterales bacterium]|nr:tyrosine-type recombinase/integrase [Campylobacterales bacterium]